MGIVARHLLSGTSKLSGSSSLAASCQVFFAGPEQPVRILLVPFFLRISTSLLYWSFLLFTLLVLCLQHFVPSLMCDHLFPSVMLAQPWLSIQMSRLSIQTPWRRQDRGQHGYHWLRMSYLRELASSALSLQLFLWTLSLRWFSQVSPCWYFIEFL